jgi:KaiC/GvpD/RAD55 family RecA-like ATPase
MKSLKEGALAFIQRVANEVKLIELEETPSNLLYEYQQNGYDLTKAKLTLIERQRQIEELAKQREQVQEVVKQEEKIVEQVEEIVAPKEVVEEQEIITVTFTITDTKENIIKVREFMKKEGIKYE